MPLIRPFRDVSEHFVINLFSLSGAVPTSRGTFVKVWNGWSGAQNLQDGGAVGGFNPPNTVSRRYVNPAQVTACTASGDYPIGVTLYDVREVDENGIPLIFNGAKQAQLQAVLSGESVPIASKGLFIYSGAAGTVIAGQPAYLSGASIQGVPASPVSTPVATRVGTFLGNLDTHGWVLVKIDL